MRITHQSAIAEVIYAIMNLSPDLKEAFSRGNPFDKLLRSYSEFTSNGLHLYRTRRCSEHYRFSEKALVLFKKTNSLDGLHAEHEVPLSKIKQELLSREFKSLESLKSYLAKSNKVVIITKAEQKIVDSKFRSNMPPNGESRLQYFGIKIAKSTEKNTLNSK